MRRALLLILSVLSLTDYTKVVAIDYKRSINQLFVSTIGDDHNPGTLLRPFATINKARDLIRQKRYKGDNCDYQITLRAGTYQLDSTIEFNGEDKNLVLKPFYGEKVILSGGKSISTTSVSEVKNSEYEKIFDSDVVGNIFHINLNEVGILDLGELRPTGYSYGFKPVWMELSINGDPYTLARWPNSSGVAIGEVHNRGTFGDATGGGKFSYFGNKPSEWQFSKDIYVEGYFNHGYARNSVSITELDTISNVITTEPATTYGFAPTSQKPLRHWYAYNVIEELDSIGEYYVDRANGILFFFADSQIESVEVSMISEPVVVLTDSHNIRIEDIQISNTRGMGIYLENTTDCLISNCMFSNIGTVAVVMGKGSSGWPRKPASRVVGSILGYRYQNSIYNNNAGFNNGVVNCKIFNTGAGGVHLGGGDRKTLISGNNYVSNCLFYNFNRIDKSYRPAIYITGVGNRIQNSTIREAPGSAIFLAGNNHIIEYNEINNVCLEVDDQGAIYNGRDPSERGNVVQYNYFHDNGNNHRTSSVYHDDGACGMTVHGNIFFRAGTLPALIGGGSDHTYTNNIFIDSPHAIHVDDRLMNWSKKSLNPGGIYDKRLKAVNYDQAPYATSYPNLAKYWNDNPSLPKRNKVESNIFCGVNQIVRGNWAYIDWGIDNKNIEKCSDDFINSITLLKIFPPDSIWEKPQNWENIPLKSIGYRDY